MSTTSPGGQLSYGDIWSPAFHAAFEIPISKPSVHKGSKSAKGDKLLFSPTSLCLLYDSLSLHISLSDFREPNHDTKGYRVQNGIDTFFHSSINVVLL